jgi:hypothetical protein
LKSVKKRQFCLFYWCWIRVPESQINADPDPETLASFVHNGSPAAGYESMRAKINADPDPKTLAHLYTMAPLLLDTSP